MGLYIPEQSKYRITRITKPAIAKIAIHLIQGITKWRESAHGKAIGNISNTALQWSTYTGSKSGFWWLIAKFNGHEMEWNSW